MTISKFFEHTLHAKLSNKDLVLGCNRFVQSGISQGLEG